MNKGVKTFLVKIAVLICFIVITDFIAGLILNYLFYKQRSGKYFTTSHALKSCNEDILIFGSSHASQHFDAPLMQKNLGKTVFNFGNQGQRLFYAYPLIKSILSYHKPKLIILNLDYDELHYISEEYDRLSVFLPYYRINPAVDSTILMMKGNEALKANSAFYRYNSTIGYILLNTYNKAYSKSMLSLGYDPIEGNICNKNNFIDVEQTKAEAVKIDQAKINCLIKLVNLIKANHVKLLITSTPLYSHSVNGPDAIYKQKLTQVLTALNVDYLDYGINSGFLGKCNFFHDESHLNPEGADAWTIQCSNYIKEKVW